MENYLKSLNDYCLVDVLMVATLIYTNRTLDCLEEAGATPYMLVMY
jgi:hypothetical protein